MRLFVSTQYSALWWVHFALARSCLLVCSSSRTNAQPLKNKCRPTILKNGDTFRVVRCGNTSQEGGTTKEEPQKRSLHITNTLALSIRTPFRIRALDGCAQTKLIRVANGKWSCGHRAAPGSQLERMLRFWDLCLRKNSLDIGMTSNYQDNRVSAGLLQVGLSNFVFQHDNTNGPSKGRESL